MTEAAGNGRGEVSERVRELVEALRAAPAVTRLHAAEEQFRADAELGRLQAGLRWNQERLQQAQREMRHDPRLFQELRDGQAQFQRHPKVVEFVTARAAALDLLRQVNLAMTEVLGVDVGASVGPAGGSC